MLIHLHEYLLVIRDQVLPKSESGQGMRPMNPSGG